jgi:hypothetical protein
MSNSNNEQQILIGDKEKFALEIYSKQSYFQIGEVQFWINNVCIGKKEDTYIKPNIIAFTKLYDLSAYSYLDIAIREKEAVFNYVISNETLHSYTLLGFGETFDEYILHPYIFNSDVIFLWTTASNFNPATGSYSNVQGAKISTNDFYQVMVKAKDILSIS